MVNLLFGLWASQVWWNVRNVNKWTRRNIYTEPLWLNVFPMLTWCTCCKFKFYNCYISLIAVIVQLSKVDELWDQLLHASTGEQMELIVHHRRFVLKDRYAPCITTLQINPPHPPKKWLWSGANRMWWALCSTVFINPYCLVTEEYLEKYIIPFLKSNDYNKNHKNEANMEIKIPSNYAK